MAKRERAIERLLGDDGQTAADLKSSQGQADTSPAQESESRRQRVKAVEPTQLQIPPEACRLWSEHDRDYEALTEEDCSDLIEGFQAAGQFTPAIGRRTGDNDQPYEIIAGARRLWTAHYLGQPLLVELREMDDATAFQLNDLENRDRKDVSAIERARRYKRALPLFESQKHMAKSLHLQPDQLSRFLYLNEVPTEVLQAYGDPRNVPLRHSSDLRALLKKNRKAVIEVATSLVGDDKQRTPNEVLNALKQAASRKENKRRQKPAVDRYEFKGKQALAVSRPSQSKLRVDMDLRAGATRMEMEELVRRALGDHFPGK